VRGNEKLLRRWLCATKAQTVRTPGGISIWRDSSVLFRTGLQLKPWRQLIQLSDFDHSQLRAAFPRPRAQPGDSGRAHGPCRGSRYLGYTGWYIEPAK
jgi:hypothetical protein